MDAIATALDVPLPLLLLNPAGEIWSFVSSSARLSAQKTSANAEEITVVLPRVQAFIAKKWALVYSKRKK